MRKKSLLAVLLVALLCMTMLLVFASCGDDSENETGPVLPEGDKDTIDPPHVHQWKEYLITKEPTETETGSVTLQCSCGETQVIELPIIDANGYNIVKTQPTCDTEGKIEATISRGEFSHTFVIKTKPLGHEFASPTYEWNEDYTQCTATRKCFRNEEHVEIAKAYVSKSITRQPTCATVGETTYTAEFNEEWAKNQTEVLNNIPKTDHLWDDIVRYEWNADYSQCVAIRKCLTDSSHVQRATSAAVETSVHKNPTCTQMGDTKYIAYFNEDWASIHIWIRTDIPARGHVWSAPSHTWSDDMSECVAVRRCVHGDGSSQMSVAKSTSKITIEPTCTTEGQTTYTAVFDDEWAGSQTEALMDIPALGHDWDTVTYQWNDDHTQCVATRQCLNDTSHVETAESTWVSDRMVKDQTCTEYGDTEYIAYFDKPWADSRKTIVSDVPPRGHYWNEIDYIWNEDNTACTAKRSCNMCQVGEESIANVTNSVALEPTCSVKGKTQYVATFKDTWATKQTKVLENIDTIPHTYVVGKTFAPTCTEDGYTARKCSVCGHDDRFDIVKALGHNNNPNSNYCPRCKDIIEYNSFDIKLLSDDTYEIYSYTGSYADLTLPSSYKGKAVTSIHDSAFSHNDTLVSVNIPSSITNIGSWAFMSCSAITDITFGANSQLKSIGESAFSGCTGLKSIAIPSSVVTMGTYAFNGCTGLTSVTFEENSKLTSIGERAFHYCSAITSITIPNGVTSIDGFVFQECSSLASITIPDSVISIGEGMFIGCSSLTSIIMPRGITSIANHTFTNCSSLTSITIPDNVTSIGTSAFNTCSALTSITIPNSVTSIGGLAFNECTKLSNVIMPSKLTSIGSRAFYKCDALTSIEIPSGVTNIDSDAFLGSNALKRVDITDIVAWCNIDFVNEYANPLLAGGELYISGVLAADITIPSGVANIKPNAFYNCASFKSVQLPDGVTTIGDNAFYRCYLLQSINLPNSIKTIGANAFEECGQLASITIPSGVTSIGKRTFCSCSSLASITIPDSVTSIGDRAFYSCRSLTSITIPSSVKTIGVNAFEYCGALTSIIIPEGVESIGEGAFKNCELLAEIKIPQSVVSIGEKVFGYCKNITSIVVDAGNTKYTSRNAQGIECNCIIDSTTKTLLVGCNTSTIPDDITRIGAAAFSYCSSLTSITIPNSVTSIGEDAFYGCSALTSINIPEGVTSIEAFTFFDCSSLTSIDIPSGVTYIGENAFVGCKKLASITIPQGVTFIGISAFSNCYELSSIIIPKTVTTVCDSAFTACNALNIYVDGQSVPAGWSSNWNPSNRPVYWYSASQPTAAPVLGRGYWHYDTDGVTPVIWEIPQAA